MPRKPIVAPELQLAREALATELDRVLFEEKTEPEELDRDKILAYARRGRFGALLRTLRKRLATPYSLGRKKAVMPRRTAALFAIADHAAQAVDEDLIATLIAGFGLERGKNGYAMTNYCVDASHRIIDLARPLAAHEVDALYEMAMIDGAHQMRDRLLKRGEAPSREREERLRTVAYEAGPGWGTRLLDAMNELRPAWEAIRSRQELQRNLVAADLGVASRMGL